MLLAYEPRYVREAQERSSNIYAAIRALKRIGIDNERIRKYISEGYEITPTYAQNYIDTVEEDERKKSSAKYILFPSHADAEGFLYLHNAHRGLLKSALCSRYQVHSDQ